jgi:2,4-dienoyl-CoA reductase-like NADH-dependent reductase (Old Yellow Enzyme family)
MSNEQLFEEGRIGPVTLRNRTIRAAAFEGMCPGHLVSQELIDYHRSVAAGGIGMTTVAYAAVLQSGLSFERQLWMKDDTVPGFQKLTDAVHKEGAAAAIQLGHCGNMAKRSVAGGRPIAPSARFNLYGPTWPRAMKLEDIREVAEAFGQSIHLARKSGFDAVEVHAGHGYLISQFLSPYTNKRRDEYGGSFENRTRFMTDVIRKARQAAGTDLALIVKMNMRDGFRGGMELEEAIEVAKILEREGADALVLSGGFVSRAPMYVMRGSMPLRDMSRDVNNPVVKILIRGFGRYLIPAVPFEEAYFLPDAKKIREAVKLPLIYVGGLVSRASVEKVMAEGFEFVSFARALVEDPSFINKLHSGEVDRSECDQTNYCVAKIYTGAMTCHKHLT